VQLLGGALAFALLVELSQIPLPSRHARMSDFIVDIVAIWFGIGSVYLLRRFFKMIPAG
jgi:VanZ family protein